MEKVPKRTNRKFTNEFKKEATLLASRVGNAQAARDLGVNESQIRQWKMKLNSNNQFNSKKSYEELERENKKLNKELFYMKEINKVLKKSTAIFSQDHMKDIK
jgi:transposase